VPADKSNPLYFEIVAIMEDLDLFSKLKETFMHPDYRVKEFNLENLIKFQRPDFVPLYLDFYQEAAKVQKEKIIDQLEEFSPVDLLPYFKKAFAKNLNDELFRLAEHLIFDKFADAKEEILDFTMAIKEDRFRKKALNMLLPKLDPFVLFKALEVLEDPLPDVKTQAFNEICLLIKKTFRRINDANEPNKAVLINLYNRFEKHVISMLQDKKAGNENYKSAKRLFYALARNRHGLIKPFLRSFFEQNFQETYFVIKEWPFAEQFSLFKELVEADPSFASLLLAVIQNNKDENLWRIVLKLLDSLDEEDRNAFRQGLLSRNRSISLQNFLNDSDATVRAAALELALELKSNNFIEISKKACKDPAPEVRLKALRCLTRQNYPQVQSYLVDALSDPDEPINFFALTSLKQILSPAKFAAHLARFLNSNNEQIRSFALKEIAELSKKKFKANFNNLNPEVRKLAAQVIQKIDQNFSEQIVADLSSLDPNTRLQAARLLENIQIDNKGKEALLAAMKDPSKLVRAAVVKTLGLMGDSNLIKNLISFFNDPDIRVKANTIEAIASLGDRQAMQILLPFLEDTNNRIRANAIVGIWKIGQINVIPVLQKMLAEKDPNMQASALWAFGEIGNYNFLNFIYPFLNNRNEMLRFNAVRSISRIKPEVLKPYMPQLRQDPSTKVRKLVSGLSHKVL
jgi:HEAT repeat protein